MSLLRNRQIAPKNSRHLKYRGTLTLTTVRRSNFEQNFVRKLDFSKLGDVGRFLRPKVLNSLKIEMQQELAHEKLINYFCDLKVGFLEEFLKIVHAWQHLLVWLTASFTIAQSNNKNNFTQMFM